MRVYLAGPMTGLPFHNFKAFFDAEDSLVRIHDWDVVNPARNRGGDDFLTAYANHEADPKPWEWYLKVDLCAMLSCDAVITLPNWAYSKGAQFEVEVARRVGIPVRSISDVIFDSFVS